jgi:glycosyltransferase involved in cell wall biosynthesis
VAVTGGSPLRINYLLEDTALFGGVKVVLHHAELLRRAGHRVRVVSPGPRPEWYPVAADFVAVADLRAAPLPEADLHVATFWTTVAAAVAQPSGAAAHFCQGFEGDLDHNRADHPRIDAAYRHRLPVLAVSPRLAELNRERFGRPVRVVPPALEPFWRPRLRIGPGREPRVLVAHPFEFTMKGVPTALGTVLRLRQRGFPVRLVRLSQWPLGDDERALVEPDEFHHHLPPAEVATLLGSCDLALAPSWPSEGFGLTVLEAMACGVPVVGSRIPSHESFAGNAARLVEGADPGVWADAALDLLGSPRCWWRARRRGIAAARPFAEARVAPVLDAAVRWAASGAWRTAP